MLPVWRIGLAGRFCLFCCWKNTSRRIESSWTSPRRQGRAAAATRFFEYLQAVVPSDLVERSSNPSVTLASKADRRGGMPSHHSGDEIEYFLHSSRRYPDKVIDRTSGAFEKFFN